MTNKLNENGLNPKQQAFCDEYIKNGNNGMLAYKKAFGLENESSCRVQASKLVTNINIVAYLKQKQQKLSEKYGITQETLLKELDEAKALAMIPDDRGKREMSVVVKIIEVKAKMLGLNEPTKLDINGTLKIDHVFESIAKKVLDLE